MKNKGCKHSVRYEIFKNIIEKEDIKKTQLFNKISLSYPELMRHIYYLISNKYIIEREGFKTRFKITTKGYGYFGSLINILNIEKEEELGK